MHMEWRMDINTTMFKTLPASAMTALPIPIPPSALLLAQDHRLGLLAGAAENDTDQTNPRASMTFPAPIAAVGFFFAVPKLNFENNHLEF